MTKAAAESLYDRDFYTWALTQAQALRHGLIKNLDLPNLAEEVEDMARSEVRELESRLEALLAHLLKWAYEPEARSKSWRLTVREQRLQVGKLLKRNPGLKPKRGALLSDAYEGARIHAAKETPLDENDFPADCPWTFEQAIDDSFFPDARGVTANGRRRGSPRQRRNRARA
jgi:Domain of unknown function DUF29